MEPKSRKSGSVQESYPDDASGRVLRDMQASGADMTIPYDVDFEHIFPDLGAAETFSKMVARRGRKTELREYDVEGSSYDWQVRVVVRLIPTYRGITKMEEDLGSVAEKCGGRADGWGIMHGPH